jgi:pimeloyl-ACP methyl ester carboxylesterase
MPEKQTLALGSGRSLFVYQEGHGPDVVLIHGAMTTSQDWLQSPVFATLAKSHRVSVVDRPGHGLSRRPRFEGAPREQADQIAEGLAQLGISRAVIVGHSYGALVALAMAERHAALVGELVLVAPLAFAEYRPLEHTMLAPLAIPIFGPLLARSAEFTQVERPMVAMLHRVMFSPAAVPASWSKSYPYALVLNAEAKVAEAEDAASMLPMSPAGTIDMRTIGVRTQVLTGTSDRVVEDERQAKTLARQLPHASLTEVEGAGHMLHHSHSEIVIDAVLAAFALVERRIEPPSPQRPGNRSLAI